MNNRINDTGTISGTQLGARNMLAVPLANYVLQYRRSETKLASLDGKVACELSSRCMGRPLVGLLKKKTEALILPSSEFPCPK